MGLRDLVRRGETSSSVQSTEGSERRRAGEHPFVALQREMNEIIENFSRGWLSGWAESGADSMLGGFNPRVEVRETDKAVQVTAELPGLSDSDVQLTLSPDGEVLQLAGEKRSEQQSESEGVHHSERFYGRFSRNIALPAPVDTDTQALAAQFKNGVLRVNLPKKQASAAPRAHRIKVKGID